MKAYGYLVLLNRPDGVRADPIKVLVDRWPDFSVIVFKPVCEQVTTDLWRPIHTIPFLYISSATSLFFFQKGDLFKDTAVYATDEGILEETIRKPSVIDWSRYICFGNTMPFCSCHGFLIITWKFSDLLFSFWHMAFTKWSYDHNTDGLIFAE